MGFMLNCGLFLGGLTSLAIGVPLNEWLNLFWI